MELTKNVQFINLNSTLYDHLMIEINFKFMNLLWNNSTAYMKFNEDIYWMEHHNWESNLCNNDYWTNLIRIVIKKNEVKNNSISLIF